MTSALGSIIQAQPPRWPSYERSVSRNGAQKGRKPHQVKCELLSSKWANFNSIEEWGRSEVSEIYPVVTMGDQGSTKSMSVFHNGPSLLDINF